MSPAMKAMNDGNNQLLAWMLDPTSPKDFAVKFVNTVDGAAMKELKGTNCYCINYIEKWEDGQQHFEEIEIVCQKLGTAPSPTTILGSRRVSEGRAMLASALLSESLFDA